MAGRGLLSRISANRIPPERSTDEVDSIIEHLRALLNTRSGDSITVPEFGIVDFTDIVHNFPEATHVLQRAIRATILAFEPRLKNVSVREVPGEDGLVLRFEITAQLVSGGRNVLRFSTKVVAGGKIDVQ